MRIGMIGLGRMGASMTTRLLRHGHEVVAFDVNPAHVAAVVREGAVGAASIGALVAALPSPRAVWLMIPAALVGGIIDELVTRMGPGDVILDGGNSHYRDAVDRAAALKTHGVDFLDVGTSGGVWGLEQGYCLMIGGEKPAVDRLDPIFRALTPNEGADAGKTPAERGYLHCGGAGAGHFVKMVHNGIEYGMMAAFAEGINLLNSANAGKAARAVDAETTPFSQPQYFQYDFDIPAITEVWRHASVIRGWLLDLTAEVLKSDPPLARFAGKVADSGEGRWTLQTAIEAGVPVPVLSSALFGRFASRGHDDFANKVLSAMRYAFGGHHEKVEAAKP